MLSEFFLRSAMLSAEQQRDEVIKTVLPLLAPLPRTPSRAGRRQLLAKTKHLARHHKEGVFTFVVSRYWNGPLTEVEKEEEQRLLAFLPANPTWYHGGLPGLKVGDLLLPPRTTGSDPRNVGSSIPDRLDRVYFTHQEPLARTYAMECRGGRVYTIRPVGQISIDPIDLRVAMLMGEGTTPFTGYCGSSAEVLAVAS